MPLEHRRSVVALALIASFMVFVDSTIVNVTLAQLATHLHASRAELRQALGLPAEPDLLGSVKPK